MGRPGRFSTKRFLALFAIGAFFAGYGAYRFLQTPPQTGSKQSLAGTHSAAPAAVELAVAPAQKDPRKLVEMSESRIDFGRVPTHYSLHQSVTFFNHGAVPIVIEGIRLEEPFAATQETLLLPPGVRTGLDVTFSPKRPGTYEGRAVLSLGAPVNDVVNLVVRGEAVLSPEDAGVPIPPPPDQAVRERREKEIAEMVAEARSALREESQAAGGEGPAAEGDGSMTESKSASSASVQEGGPSIPHAVVLAAFGQTANAAEDPNQIPVEIPGKETEPDLPPANGGDEGAEEEDGEQQDDDPQPDVEDLKAFTVAPNSLVAVHSSQEPLQLQTFPVNFSPDGASFQVNGQIRFPELALAFGQRVEVEQWGGLAGTLAPDGSMQMKLIVRLEDPGEAVLDLPITLTTGMAVGYSAAGRVMFANGVTRNAATGDFKVVGITNIPVGAGSALEKAPVYVELLGRLEL